MMPTIMNLASRATSTLKDEFTVAMHSSLLSAVAELIVKIADDYGLDRDELTTRYIGASPDTDIASPVHSSSAENSIAGPPARPEEEPLKKTTTKKKTGGDRLPCAAINAKKRPCTRFAVEGGCGLCKLHARLAADGDSSSSAAAAVPKSKKAKKNDDAKKKSQHAPLENDPVEQAAFDAMFVDAIPLHPERSMNDEDLEKLAMELFGDVVDGKPEEEQENETASAVEDDQRTVTDNDDEEEYDLEKDLLHAFEFDDVDAAEFI